MIAGGWGGWNGRQRPPRCQASQFIEAGRRLGRCAGHSLGLGPERYRPRSLSFRSTHCFVPSHTSFS